MLTEYTLLGFTIFGFWLPFIFWLAVGVWLLCLPKAANPPVLDTTNAILVLTSANLLLSVVTRNSHVLELHQFGAILVAPLYFSLYAGRISLWVVGLAAYLSTLLTDALSALFLSAKAPMGFTWAPLDCIHAPVFDHFRWISGDGLADELVTVGPFFT